MTSATIHRQWRMILLLALAELLVMSVWFSASAVVPSLTVLWELDSSGQAWLTMSVQIGFVVGALGSAILTLADRIPSVRMFTTAAFVCAILTIMIPIFATGLTTALVLRFLTGVFLAGVYPVGMKIMTTWTEKNRGFGIGLLVGALTIGSAMPHLIKVFGTTDWQLVLVVSSILAGIGGLLGLLLIQEGPNRVASAKFRWSQIGIIFRDKDVMLANLGYLGHMWELYAMWTWIPVFLISSFAIAGIDAVWANVLTFLVIAIGGIGSLVAGQLADKVGRTLITSGAMLISGACAVLIGQLYGGSPLLLALVALVWGTTIVADSAQFSACVSELAEKQLIGTALTLQTSLGFLLTLFTIQMIPIVEAEVGWTWAFAILAIGPAFGILAMLILRRSAGAVKLANGNR